MKYALIALATMALGSFGVTAHAQLCEDCGPGDPPAGMLATYSPQGSDAAIDSNLTITFEDDVLSDSGTITIYNASDDTTFESFDVATSDRISVVGALVTIDPISDFNYDSTYYVQMPFAVFYSLTLGGASDISDTTTWRFTTVAPTTTPTPTPTPSEAPDPTPAPTPDVAGTISSDDGQGHEGDCCAHDDGTGPQPKKSGSVLGATTSENPLIMCSLLPHIRPMFDTLFRTREMTFGEMDFWSYRVKQGAWQALEALANTMGWYKSQKQTYDKSYDTSDPAIHARCTDKALVARITETFQEAYERNPNASEYGYWLRRLRLTEKTSTPDLLGAMQWHLEHRRDHSRDDSIIRDFSTFF